MAVVARKYADEMDEAPVRRLTRQEAKNLRASAPLLSPWWVVGLQCVVGAVLAGMIGLVSGKSSLAWSAAYGAIAVIIPAAIFARGLMSQFSSINAATAGFGFFVWEAVKMAVSIGLLAAAPKLIADLNWLAMLAGLFVTLKMYWVALLMRPKPKTV